MANIAYDPLIISQPSRPYRHRGGLLRRLGEWRRRARERAELARFGSRDLRDIGLTPADAAYEINKPFWRE
jgi:uncharacterized protein YjiS (DUF1127 family)